MNPLDYPGLLEASKAALSLIHDQVDIASLKPWERDVIADLARAIDAEEWESAFELADVEQSSSRPALSANTQG